MSWLRKLFGGDRDEPRPDRKPIGSIDEFGAITNRGRAEKAKAELMRILRERGAHAAVVVYEGGHDEGGVTEIALSSEPLGVPAAEWDGDAAGFEQVDMEAAWDAWGTESDDPERRALDELMNAAEEFIAARWEGFAGEFEVHGRVVVDVDAQQTARHDVVTIDEAEGGGTLRDTEIV